MVLDEATSALDEKSQDKMMEIVIKELPKATIVSVAHRVELEAFHSRKIVLERRKGGAKLVSDIDLIPRKGKRRLLGRFLRHRKAAEEGGVVSSRSSPPSSSALLRNCALGRSDPVSPETAMIDRWPRRTGYAACAGYDSQQDDLPIHT